MRIAIMLDVDNPESPGPPVLHRRAGRVVSRSIARNPVPGGPDDRF
jgi:hypothetical protein